MPDRSLSLGIQLTVTDPVALHDALSNVEIQFLRFDQDEFDALGRAARVDALSDQQLAVMAWEAILFLDTIAQSWPGVQFADLGLAVDDRVQVLAGSSR